MTVLEITIQRGSGDVRPVVLEHRPTSLCECEANGDFKDQDSMRVLSAIRR